MLFHVGNASASRRSQPKPDGNHDLVSIKSMLRRANLRPTRQRIALGLLLFRDAHLHATPDGLHQTAIRAGERLSLATVYNTLNQFADAGLVRKMGVPGDRTYYDTNTGDHSHFYIADEERIIDIADGAIHIGPLPAPPDGYVISRVDVLLHLQKRRTPSD